MFRKYHQGRRPTNIVFVIFRLVLSLIMFAVLLGGIYSAYKHFSGLDPLKLDPQAVLKNIILARTPQQVIEVLSSLKIDPKILGKSVPVRQSGAVAFRFLLVADSHSDNVNLAKAINQAKESYPDLKFIIGLGDYTEVGTIDELKNTKKELNNSSLRYFLIPGDHDLWDCRNRALTPTDCFNQVFGSAYQSFAFENFEFLLLNNSDNYTGFDGEQLKWITEELERTKGAKGVFVFVHTPLYHPSSDHVMGWEEKSLKSQSLGLMFQLKEAGVAKVFAGDIHYFSEYAEPKTDISMITVGALTLERNPQAPRFAVVSAFDNGSVKVEDVEIK